MDTLSAVFLLSQTLAAKCPLLIYITAKVGKLEYRAKLFLQNFEKRCKIAIFAGTLGKPA